MHYQGKTAVITGGGSGLGAAMADQFAAAGANVALLDIDGASAQAKAAELRGRGVKAIAVAVDVASRARLKAAAAEVANTFGACDILCANVGVQQFGAIDKLTSEDWSWVLSVNVRGVVNTVAEFLPLVRRATGERHVVVTASASYFTPGVRMAAYVTTKYAVVGYAEVLRRELAAEGINVSILFPGGMATRHLESSIAARPGKLGPSKLDPADIEAMMASADMTIDNHVSTAEHAVRNLLDELRAKQPYIITHGAYKKQVEAQQREVLDAFDRMLAKPGHRNRENHTMTLDPLQILIEKDAIRELKARYFRFLDTKKWDQWTEVFEPQFQHEMEYEQQQINGPREDFVKFVAGALEGLVTVHHGHNPEIELTSPTTARAIWPFVDRLQPAPESTEGGITLTGYGHYHETYVKSEAGWRMKTQRVTRLRMDFDG